MLADRWIIDRVPTERFPDYTRANAGEVLADPVTPLGWTFCWESGVVLGCREGFATFGVYDADEYGDPPECFGLFGGYFYNSLTQGRLLGVRMPGASPEQIDKAYFDERPDVPPYVPKPWHESERHAQKLTETAEYVLSTDKHQPVLDQQETAKRIRDERPDLGAVSNEELVARARSLQPQMVDNFKHHVTSSLGASFGPGVLAAVAADLGRPEDGLRLITGIGDVDSADIARELWVLSRMIRASGELTAAFDAGLDGLGERLAGTALRRRLRRLRVQPRLPGAQRVGSGRRELRDQPRPRLRPTRRAAETVRQGGPGGRPQSARRPSGPGSRSRSRSCWPTTPRPSARSGPP